MSAPVQKRRPLRSCVVCRQTSDKRALLRVVRLPEGQGGTVVVDKTGKRSGRGAYVCPDAKCINAARVQKRFERSLKLESGPLSAELFEELAQLAAPTISE
jgi:predicted RNA-binding protein YlxR (DUF448 family)